MKRQFLYLAALNSKKGLGLYTLHRIEASQFFYPKGAPETAAAAVEVCSMPPPIMTFYPPQSKHIRENMEFMLFGRNRNKIVCTDHTGRAILYDDGLHAVRVLPSLGVPKWRSVPLAVGDSLFVMEAVPMNDQKKQHQSFEVLMYGKRPSIFKGEDFFWHSIPPPPYVYAPGYSNELSGMITACTVVDSSSIWISTEGVGTYCFDTANSKWSKTGPWRLPFKGLAEYVPEYNLWFGISARDHGVLCVSDLGATSAEQMPVVFQDWEGFAAPEGTEIQSYLLQLGSGRFCVVKLFKTTRQVTYDPFCILEITVDMFVMFTGVEIHRCGRGFKVIKHKSFRYSMGGSSMPQILY